MWEKHLTDGAIICTKVLLQAKISVRNDSFLCLLNRVHVSRWFRYNVLQIWFQDYFWML
jgi:hypothetical protein